jgi:hypothetical protein
VAVWRAHHGNLDALVAESSDTSGPFAFDRGPPFELEAELAKEIDRRGEILDDDSYVVHPLNRHMPNVSGGHSGKEPQPPPLQMLCRQECHGLRICTNRRPVSADANPAVVDSTITQ